MKRKKRIKYVMALLTAVVLVIGICFPASAEENLAASAHSACMLDVSTNQILYEKNAREKMSMASTTKIMTALLAVESGRLDELVTVPPEAPYVEGSSLYLKAGEQIYLSDLATGMMLNSGNDAAYTIAVFLGGNIEQFARQMTEKAHEIGAVDTTFKNPHGLSEQGHETTAYDLALISSYAMKNETFRKIVSQKSQKGSIYPDVRDLYFQNHNKLLSLYEYAIGVKTGFTKEAGRCLVGAADKEGLSVVTVTLGAPDDWNDHIRMFRYAFEHYERQCLVSAGTYFKTVSVQNGELSRLRLFTQEDLFCTVKKGEQAPISVAYHVPDAIEAPIRIGAPVGSIDVLLGEQVVGSLNLTAEKAIVRVEPITFKKIMKKFIENWLLFAD